MYVYTQHGYVEGSEDNLQELGTSCYYVVHLVLTQVTWEYPLCAVNTINE